MNCRNFFKLPIVWSYVTAVIKKKKVLHIGSNYKIINIIKDKIIKYLNNKSQVKMPTYQNAHLSTSGGN